MTTSRASGHINEKRPGYWEVTVYLGKDPVSGAKRYKSRCLRGTRKEARHALAMLEVEVGGDAVRAQSATTVAVLVNEYIVRCRTRGLSPTTINGYESIARGIAADRLGETPLDRVTGRNCDDYYARMNKRGCGSGTINRHHSLLHASVNQACKWQWVNRNPVDDATPPKERHRKRKLPGAEVVPELIEVAAKSRNPSNAVAIHVAFTSSERRGELCDRRWTDLEENTRVLWIHGSIAQLPGGRLIPKETKDYQDRTILLDQKTVDALIRHRSNQERIANDHGVRLREDAYIFANQEPRHGGAPDGSVPSKPNRLTQAFRRIRLKVPGAENLKLHELRHLSASHLIAQGETVPNVAQRLGHHVETLVRRYAHETQPSALAVEGLGQHASPASQGDAQEALVNDPARLLVLGDTHGNLDWVERMIATAADLECDAIVQLGDFGYWPHTADGLRFLRGVEQAAKSASIPLCWVDGNHENHERLRELKPARDGFVYISDHVAWAPRGHRWTWSGVRFGALGGAFSVDWRRRVKFVTWWPNEVLEDTDVVALGLSPLDVLLTHDSPIEVEMVGTFELRADDQARADEGRRLISQAVANSKPRVLLHGHWHQRVSRVLSGEVSVRVEGLASDIEGDGASWGVLSLPLIEFTDGNAVQDRR